MSNQEKNHAREPIRRRCASITIRLAPIEKALIKRKAQNREQSIADYLVQLICNDKSERIYDILPVICVLNELNDRTKKMADTFKSDNAVSMDIKEQLNDQKRLYEALYSLTHE